MANPESLLRALAARHPAEAARVRQWLGERVRELVNERLSGMESLRTELREVPQSWDQLEDRLDAARARLDPGPFRAEMTVHAAHARDPRVRQMFAARGLPGCPDCAVGADETLAEAASAEGFALAELLEALRGLESR